MRLILVSGLSGSGKSIALNVLEDSGYYCVDNLPAKLLPDLVGFLQQSNYNRIAVSVDIRSGDTLRDLPQHVAALRDAGIDLRVLFLEAQTDTLVHRFSETRRRHPLSDNARTLPEAIEAERELLSDIGALGHRIDTSSLNPNSLRMWVKDFVTIDRSRLTLLFQSFGFKQGIPLDSDLVFDVRCLPNPHYDQTLRPFCGKDACIVEFLEKEEQVHQMYNDIERFIERWLPAYISDSRHYLTVAIGCTGGQHRSVYFVERLARRFGKDNQVLVRHRQLA